MVRNRRKEREGGRAKGEATRIETQMESGKQKKNKMKRNG